METLNGLFLNMFTAGSGPSTWISLDLTVETKTCQYYFPVPATGKILFPELREELRGLSPDILSLHLLLKESKAGCRFQDSEHIEQT